MNSEDMVIEPTPVKVRGSRSLVDVVGFCETCGSGIVINMNTAENEKGKTIRKYCKDLCRKNRKKGRNRK